ARVPEGRRASHSNESSQQFLTCRCLSGIHADEFARAPFVFKLHEAVNHCKQGVVLAAADVLTRLPFRAALARENIATQHALAAELFQAEPLRVRVAPVSR